MFEESWQLLVNCAHVFARCFLIMRVCKTIRLFWGLDLRFNNYTINKFITQIPNPNPKKSWTTSYILKKKLQKTCKLHIANSPISQFLPIKVVVQSHKYIMLTCFAVMTYILRGAETCLLKMVKYGCSFRFFPCTRIVMLWCNVGLCV